MLQSKGGSAADVGGHAEAAVDDDGGNVSNQSSHKSKVNLVIMPF